MDGGPKGEVGCGRENPKRVDGGPKGEVGGEREIPKRVEGSCAKHSIGRVHVQCITVSRKHVLECPIIV
jgi:hypothetical protein